MAEGDDLTSPLGSPSPPTSPDDASSPPHPTLSPRTASDTTTTTTTKPPMTASSTPLGSLNAARRPAGPPSTASARNGPTFNNPDIAAKMKALMLSRQAAPGPAAPGPGGAPGGVQSPGPSPAGFPSNFKLPTALNRPAPHMANSSPAVPGAGAPGRGLSMAERRGMKLPGGLPGAPSPNPAAPGAPAGRQKPKMTLSAMKGGPTNGDANGGQEAEKPKEQSQMQKYAEFVDTENGALTFKGKAVVHGGGIDFSNGRSFNISLDQVDTLDEMGKGNYGTVYKVRHSRPKFRRTGQGLAGNKSTRPGDDPSSNETTPADGTAGGTTGVVMAMKEMRLELDDAKFASIIMELDILHRCISPHIVDFYGAFFQEGAVYICMEFMDGGSIDKIYGDGVPEGVLRKITLGTTLGLKCLKEEHNIIHRDVKPTNILANTRGQVKICDFGVSGNLVASIAKTNIGCQSYMAPERISSGGMAAAGPGGGGGTYSVQSDIWSLGLSIIECALGRYPYPPETYDNIFSQLSAIVDGAPPDLPANDYSEVARDFVAGCLNKIPKLRPTYPMLLQHAWLAPLAKPETIEEEDEEAAEAAAEAERVAREKGEEIKGSESKEEAKPVGDDDGNGDFVDREVGEWVIAALDRRKRGVMGKSVKPALHAAPLDAGQGLGSPLTVA